VIIHDVAQRSAEWHALRLGVPTSSEFHKILTPTGKLSTQSTAYMDWLLAEWLMGPMERPETQWMQRGTDMEDEAVRSYEFEREAETRIVGFVTTDDGLIGASPDRFVGQWGILELKCPAPNTHIGYLLRRTHSADYWTQIQGQLWICERDWVDIQSYHPGLPTVIIRVARDEKYIALLAASLSTFVADLEARKRDLQDQFGLKPWSLPVRAESTEHLLSDDDVESIVRSKFPNE